LHGYGPRGFDLCVDATIGDVDAHDDVVADPQFVAAADLQRQVADVGGHALMIDKEAAAVEVEASFGYSWPALC